MNAPPRFARLSRQDFANLVIEARDTPMHMAVLLLLDPLAAPGIDAAAIRAAIGDRAAALPELRQVLAQPVTGGRPIWVDAALDMTHHVLFAAVPPPGGDAELLAVVEPLVAHPLSRRRPLWEVWVLTGLRGGRWAVLIKVHHAVTDGLGMLRVVTALLGPGSRPTPDWVPSPPPSAWAVTRDRLAGAARFALAVAREVAEPAELAGDAAAAASTLVATAEAAANRHAAELNRAIGGRRRIAVVRLRLAEVRRVAHRHSVKVNDIVLELAAAGLAAALRRRHEPVIGRSVNALLAVDPRHPGEPAILRNQAGSIVVPLPLGGGDDERLSLITVASRRAKASQRYGVVEGLMVLVVLAGLGRRLSRSQSAVQLAVSNLAGPTEPLQLLGCRVEDAIPLTPISGSVTLDFCALSYAGRFNIAILADADAWPDLRVVTDAMLASWRELSGSGRRVRGHESRP